MLTDSATAMHPAASAVPGERPGGAPELSVEMVSDYRSFRELEPVWNRLVEEAGIDHPFLTYEWVLSWWECFGGGKTLHVFVVRAGSEAIAIAPLMLSRTRMYGFPVRLMEFLANVYTERFDFIIARRPADAYRAIWLALVSRQACWDVLRLCQVPDGSRTLEDLPGLARQAGFFTGRWPSSCAPYVPLIGSWDGYFDSLDRKHRANLRNRFTRLCRLGPVELETVTSCEQLDEALEEGWRLEAAAWKGNAGTAVGDRPELRRFYATLAQRAARRGWLHLHFLRARRRRIAFGYTLFFKNKLYLLKPGYDPRFAPFSPSNLLCCLALREAFARDAAEYDFLGENDPWKRKWAGRTRAHQWLFVFPRRLRARLLHFAKFTLAPMLKPRVSE